MNDNSPTGRRPEPPEMQTLHKRTLARLAYSKLILLN